MVLVFLFTLELILAEVAVPEQDVCVTEHVLLDDVVVFQVDVRPEHVLSDRLAGAVDTHQRGCYRLGCQIWHPKWVRLAPNGTNLRLLKIRSSTFWLGK